MESKHQRMESTFKGIIKLKNFIYFFHCSLLHHSYKLANQLIIIMNKRIYINLTFIFFLILSGCNDKPNRHFELGNWYYEKGLIDEAILEYREVIRLYPHETKLMNREELELASKAHFNLAIAYSKKGWFEYALKEAVKTFDMYPTKENYDIVELLKKRRSLDFIEINSDS